MTDEFTRQIIRIIIARVAQEKDFTAISETALEILVDAVIHRLSEIARAAAATTTHCGRTDTNGLDIFAGLFRFGETPESLAHYLRRANQVPPFEFLVEPYPLPRLSRLHTPSAPPTGQNTVPFRANTTIIAAPTMRHVPLCFPPAPNRYTLDHRIEPDAAVPDDPDMIRRREADQNRIKRALAEISAGRGAEAPHAVKFDCELAQLIATDMLAKPTPLLESPIYQLEGVRGSEDPEFLPLTEVTDAMIAGESSRDAGFMLSILSIQQGQTEPGTLKNATYNSQPAPEKERGPSTE
jgi:histone H3/H4